MKKKGFTLIELLAVIVILAIIALIAIPLIGNVIEKAKIGALENSVNGLVESANMYYANQSIKGENPTETIFDFANGEQTSTEKLEYKGKVYNGKLILHANGKVAVCIDDKEHYAYKNKDNDEIVSGTGTCLYDGTTGDFSSNSPVEDLKKQVAAATATSDKVLEGSTIYTLSGLVAGTMANNTNKTLSATTVVESEDKTNALITIPSGGYYDETSQISVPIETIKNNVSIGGSLKSTEFYQTIAVGGYNTTSTKTYTISGTGTLFLEVDFVSNNENLWGAYPNDQCTVTLNGQNINVAKSQWNPIFRASDGADLNNVGEHAFYFMLNVKSGDTLQIQTYTNISYANIYIVAKGFIF